MFVDYVQRNVAIAAATKAGHSRRVLGRLLDVSYTRVQQLLRDPERRFM